MTNEKSCPVLEISRLSKSLGGRPILHDISFSVSGGEIFGFVGPNGSGKTTTIKLILGLLRLETGEIKINGKSLSDDFESAISCVGGIIENPEMYKYLTGRQNLMQYVRMHDGISKERVDEVTDIVRLTGRIDDKVSKYSLGMRQRLGLAQAILNHPKLLILDEPTNGLDPAGIKDLRDILKYLAHEEGCAVFISSHLLSELEMVCDTVGIIDRGHLIDVRAVSDLRRDENESESKFKITSSEKEALFKLLSERGLAIEEDGDNFIFSSSKSEAEDILRSVILAGIPTLGLTPVQKSLEDAFIEKTTNNAQGGVGV